MRLLAIGFLCMAATAAYANESSRKADFVYVDKSERAISFFNGKELLAKYRISLSRSSVGHKEREGDKRTPEGTYTLDYKNPNSQYYRSIHISYPNQQDRTSAKRRGVSPGGAIMIHGQPNRSRYAASELQQYDWTDGCIALTNTEMDVVWAMVDVPVRIQIAP